MLRQDTFAFAQNFLPRTDRYGRTTGVDAAGLGGLLVGRLLGDALYRWFNRGKPIYDNNGNPRTGETVASENRQNGERNWQGSMGVPAKSNIGTEPNYNTPVRGQSEGKTWSTESTAENFGNEARTNLNYGGKTFLNQYNNGGLLGKGVLNHSSPYFGFNNDITEKTQGLGYTAKNTGVNPGAGTVTEVTDYHFKPEDYDLYKRIWGGGIL